MGTAKEELRRRLLRARRERAGAADPEGRAVAAQVLSLPEVAALAPGSVVAAYDELPGEPLTRRLREELRGRGVHVLLPVTLPDRDLDWVVEGRGAPLGVEGVRRAAVVVVPGLAAGRDGQRLGRGGGSYDRALARLAPGTPTVLLLWDEELLDAVPAEPHDRPVDVVVTPTRVVRVGGPDLRAP